MRWTRTLLGGPKTPGNFVQDGPPKGGFPTVNVRRSLPGGGLSSIALMSGLTGTFIYGMYTLISANRQRREFKREEHDIRMAVLPFLSFEEDVKSAFVKSKMLANEEELMKGVPNWEAGASAYKTTYMPAMDVFGYRA